MWILRLILILLGIAFIAGVYFYTRRNPPRTRHAQSVRNEPSLTMQGQPPSADDRTEPYVSTPHETSAPPSAEEPEPEVTQAPETPGKAPPESTKERIFSLTLRLPREGIEADRLLHHLKRLGLVLNEQHIYHRVEAGGELIFSVANLFEPGTLHPLAPDALLQGLNFFFIAVPSSATSMRFDRMLGTAYECARSFGGQLEDAQHRRLTAARELELKLRAAGATAHE